MESARGSSCYRCARLTLLAALGALLLAPAVAAASRLESFELPSRHVDPATPGGELPDDRTVPKVNVLLPDGYDDDSRRGYPVLWLHHGAFGGVDSWLDDFDELSAGRRAILVMPDGGRFGMYTDWWNDGRRGDPAWATYHLRVLRRTIERRYPIRAGRRWHAIAGISMGGQGTLRYAAMLPGYFGSAVGFSAAFPDMQSGVARPGLDTLPADVGPGGVYAAIFGSEQGPYAEGNSPQALAANYGHTRVYLTSGNGMDCPEDPPTGSELDRVTEILINAQQGPFAAAIRAQGADVNAVTTCGVHTVGVWNRAFVAARKWGFFRPVAERPRRWRYRTIAESGNMWGLRFRFARPPSKVAEFERSGRTLSATGSGKVRIRGRRRCRFGARLPFDRRLPRSCRQAAQV
ncbi:MAG TPA: alpha/beta hydrolase-fold protein [Solirubrobacterales bacterium]|nr:alpha/beta hydrolase-fold protein [Solirubrobacterales bacterium]